MTTLSAILAGDLAAVWLSIRHNLIREINYMMFASEYAKAKTLVSEAQVCLKALEEEIFRTKKEVETRLRAYHSRRPLAYVSKADYEKFIADEMKIMQIEWLGNKFELVIGYVDKVKGLEGEAYTAAYGAEVGRLDVFLRMLYYDALSVKFDFQRAFNNASYPGVKGFWLARASSGRSTELFQSFGAYEEAELAGDDEGSQDSDEDSDDDEVVDLGDSEPPSSSVRLVARPPRRSNPCDIPMETVIDLTGSDEDEAVLTKRTRKRKIIELDSDSE